MNSGKPPTLGSGDKVPLWQYIFLAGAGAAYLAGLVYLGELSDQYPQPWSVVAAFGAPAAMIIWATSSRLGRWRWVSDALSTVIVLVCVVYPFVRYGLQLW